MDFDKIISDLKNKVYHPVYFLMGEEPYFIDAIAGYIEKNVLEEAEKEFNQTILYGGETNILQVIGEAKSFPMMSNYRVVIIKEAQNMKDLIPKDKTSSSSNSPLPDSSVPRFNKEETEKQRNGEVKIHPLAFYLDHPQKTTILVFCYKYKTADMRTAFARNLSKRAVVLRSDKIYDNKVPAWVEQYIKRQNYSIDHRACQLLTDFLGNDLGKIAMEIEKLMINLPPKTQITADHIQQYIGISKEYNNFELQAAIGGRDLLKANRIINYFASDPKDNPFVMTIALLAGYFSKILVYHHLADKSQNNVASALRINPFFVKEYAYAAGNYPSGKVMDVISLLRKYDLRSKGFDGNSVREEELMKEMVFRIMH